VFLLGVDPTDGSAEGAPYSPKEFISSFHDALQYTLFRILLHKVWFLIPQSKYLRACRITHEYLDYYIEEALNKKEVSTLTNDNPLTNAKSTSLLAGLAIQNEDRGLIRNQILQGMMASQETTSTLLGNACFLLARHPKYWQQIRLASQGLDLDFDTLLDLTLVRNILLETLRLYPVFPRLARAARQDTVLPVGGGPNQDLPIFVPKDTIAVLHYYTLHRDKAVFGPDVEEFRPERWKTVQPSTWEFMAFGGGDRACLGQQKVLVEATYVLLRLAKRFTRLESRDQKDWEGESKLTCKSKNGCKVALYCGPINVEA
jgi:cytochrome P450